MNFFNPLKNQPDEKTEPISRQVWTCNHVIHIGHYEITIKDHKIPSLTILTFDSPLVHPLDNKPLTQIISIGGEDHIRPHLASYI